MERILYWLWLSLRFRCMNNKVKSLYESFGDVENIYRSKSFGNIRGLREKDIISLMDKDMTEAERALGQIVDMGCSIITYEDSVYPQILKNLHDPPCVLYAKGKMPELDDVLTIGVVGTRSMSEYGRTVTERICSSLAEAGVVTVGGLAAGIDTVGAWATISAGSVAVGVIGCGIDIVFPQENAGLYEAVAERGCILSEYPPGSPPLSKHFPVRNRIIAGLSRGVLVTEAPQRSGALITAHCALDEGRDVFAVPRNITDSWYRGTNILIQEGAKLVQNAEDILCEYPYAKRINQLKSVKDGITVPKQSDAAQKTGTGRKSSVDKSRFDKLEENERVVAELLIGGDMQIDEMARLLNIPAGELNTRLVILEMKGILVKLPGNKYKLKV